MEPRRQPDSLVAQKHAISSLHQEILSLQWRVNPLLGPIRHAGLTAALFLLLVLPLWGPGGQAYAQSCSITLKPTVSGCYQNSGSKATVSVEVTWSNATVSPTANDASDAITVSYAGLTRIINPGPYTSFGSDGTIVSPQVVSFEVDLSATASGQLITATSTAVPTCTGVSSGINLPPACPPTVCATGQTGGTVFNDFDADGLKDPGETTGVSGVEVKAYDCNGNRVGTTITDAFGIYAFTGSLSYPIRVEFTNLPSYAGMGTPNGTNGRTTVQFVNTATCNVDLGILDNSDYCQSNPKLIIPCYVHGDPLPVNSPAGQMDGIVSFDYTASGLKNPALMAHAPASQIGATWGTAYNKFTKKVFTSATIRRHAGLGPLGIGGIYVADFTTPPAGGSSFTFTNFVDVSTLGINVGSVATNATRGLNVDPSQPSTDAEGYAAIGRRGIGGIDVSEDGNVLFLANLFDNKVYAIDITAYNTSGTLPTAANVKSYDLGSDISCTGGNLHIWAVKVYKRKLYAGFVCDASTSQSKSDLRAYIKERNETTNQVTTIFDFPLTYPKGSPTPSGDPAYNSRTGWYPWTDDWATKLGNLASDIIYPEPILSAVEFDIDGSMVLSFVDRTSMQVGWLDPSPSGTGSHYNFVGGDVLRAYSVGGSFLLENNAKAGPTTGFGLNNNQGPGFGEFYNDNLFVAGSLAHAENSTGGLALLPGSGEVVVPAMDPIDVPPGGVFNDYIWAGGVRRLSNATGQLSSSFMIYNTISDNRITFGKAAGLGDAVLTCDIPTYLEIGNRLWIDSDKDGIQDPCELPLANVKVALFRGNTLVANTTSSASGEYYFNTTNAPTLLPNTTYSVRFGTDGASDQFDSNTDVLTVNGERYNATKAFSSAPTASTLNDSNAQKSGGYLSASVTTGAAGSVNHSIDAGFYVACPLINCYPTLVSRN
ncbi:SdrD B-like domain-containing protein [Spirosoma fluviale]|uniref:SdrD B-like domain n=1 Tax=Spirosoma fluviale TaxID=1597977 RepID=A0A286G5A6_9BACT|nr:SdrD B-like domain-containing protein [Spirosoma fluviale]SOD90675.1 SdrD B-like domain [Spirosoma fluviale]